MSGVSLDKECGSNTKHVDNYYHFIFYCLHRSYGKQLEIHCQQTHTHTQRRPLQAKLLKALANTEAQKLTLSQHVAAKIG